VFNESYKSIKVSLSVVGVHNKLGEDFNANSVCDFKGTLNRRNSVALVVFSQITRGNGIYSNQKTFKANRFPSYERRFLSQYCVYAGVSEKALPNPT